jgi:ApaG protein
MKASPSKITEGIKVSVKTKFLENQSSSENNYYLFSYRITIENRSDYTVQLLTRHWDIFDSNFEHREVDGDGVIGEQPVILPDESFEYESACSLNSDMGRMHGHYTLLRQVDNSKFNVLIPEFELIAPYRLN